MRLAKFADPVVPQREVRCETRAIERGPVPGCLSLPVPAQEQGAVYISMSDRKGGQKDLQEGDATAEQRAIFYAATDGVLAAIVSRLGHPDRLGSALGTVRIVVALSRMAAATGFGLRWLAVGAGTAIACVGVLLIAALVAATVLMRRTIWSTVS